MSIDQFPYRGRTGQDNLIERAQEKLRELRSQRGRKIYFIQHLEHHEQRLDRLAELMCPERYLI